MADQPHEIVISKEDAVFWLDENGRWHNVDGPFKHKKIIDYFHASIHKDENGYYLSQKHNNLREKVYFRYADAALFVFEVNIQKDIELILNTGQKIKLDPLCLYISNDCLYMHCGGERIKFDERSLMKLSRNIDEEGDQYILRMGSKRYPIRKV